MASGYSTYRKRALIAQKYQSGAMRYNCQLLCESASSYCEKAYAIPSQVLQLTSTS
jgi:hypothetical protein